MGKIRMLGVVLLSSMATSLLLFGFVRRPDGTLMPFGSSGEDDGWVEYGSDGTCLFLSPLAELTPDERRAAYAYHDTSNASTSTPSHPSPRGTLAYLFSSFLSPSTSLNSLPITPSSELPVNPILGLLAEGERKWGDLMSRQSRSLEEAVTEYERRYGMRPPKGFGGWWSFAQSHHVLLPDEYDPIHASLLPFYALPPDDFLARTAEAERVPETYTLIVKAGGKVVLQWNDDYARNEYWAARPRADAQINLLEPFLERLGEMRITFSIHDEPSVVLPYERRAELEGIAKGPVGAHTSNLKELDSDKVDWLQACSPDSPARKGTFERSDPGTINFVTDPISYQDPCSNPYLLHSHTHYLHLPTSTSLPKPHTRLLPILSLSRTTLNADIPLPPTHILSGPLDRASTGREPVGGWSAKIPKLYWRGSPSVHPNLPIGETEWKEGHRSRLHELGVSNSSSSSGGAGGMEEVLVAAKGKRSGKVAVEKASKKELREQYLDVQLEGEWKCAEKAVDCEHHRKLFSSRHLDSFERSNLYKYVLDVDSESWSKRFPKLMAARNLVLKAGAFPEWNMASLPPWMAYVPVNLDYTDLYSILSFFVGSPKSGKVPHDRVARRIASNGQCWVERTWRREDMEAYAFRLYLEYERLWRRGDKGYKEGDADFVMGERITSNLEKQEHKPVPGGVVQ